MLPPRCGAGAARDGGSAPPTAGTAAGRPGGCDVGSGARGAAGGPGAVTFFIISTSAMHGMATRDIIRKSLL
jgi:hypothetical protein